MTLSQIDQRLHLFKEYLAYKMDNIVITNICLPWVNFGDGRYFIKSSHSEKLLTFDQWLYVNNHIDLVVYDMKYYQAACDPITFRPLEPHVAVSVTRVIDGKFYTENLGYKETTPEEFEAEVQKVAQYYNCQIKRDNE